jgi:hypothetical protein
MNHRSNRFSIAVAVSFVVLAADADAHPPSGIVVDSRGIAYFQDGLRGVWRVEHNREPTLVTELAWHWMVLDLDGKFSRSPEQFAQYYARLTPEGVKPTLIACSDFPIAFGVDGNLYSAHMHSLKILKRTPQGAESVLVTPDQFTVHATRPFGVTGITCGPDGRLYLFLLADDSGEHAVYSIDMNGTIREFAKNFITERLPESERHSEAMPEYSRGMAVDTAGNVFIAVTGNRCVMKLTPEREASVILKAEKPWSPTGVAEHNGDIYVLEYDDETPTEGRNWPPRVRKVARDGTVSVVAEIRR